MLSPPERRRMSFASSKKHGFYLKRQTGSHAIYKHPDGRRTTVPMHGKHDLAMGLLHQILKNAGLDVGDL